MNATPATHDSAHDNAHYNAPYNAHYKAPGRFTRAIFNPLVSGLVKLGVSAKGAAILSVRGRRTGEWHSTPVNPLTFEGEQFLVAPRGETQWVRNLRVAGCGRIRRHRRTDEFTAVELEDAAKPHVLRAYLHEWAWEVGTFFEGVGADSSDEQLAEIAGTPPISPLPPAS